MIDAGNLALLARELSSDTISIYIGDSVPMRAVDITYVLPTNTVIIAGKGYKVMLPYLFYQLSFMIAPNKKFEVVLPETKKRIPAPENLELLTIYSASLLGSVYVPRVEQSLWIYGSVALQIFLTHACCDAKNTNEVSSNIMNLLMTAPLLWRGRLA